MMLIDQRGSEVLTRNECLRLLALRAGGIGRVGLVKDGHAVIVPVNYLMMDQDVIIQVGPGDMLAAAANQTIVAFEVDDVSSAGDQAWSVLIQGLATVVPHARAIDANVRQVVAASAPLVPEPGHSLVRIRTGVLSGRRFPLVAAASG